MGLGVVDEKFKNTNYRKQSNELHPGSLISESFCYEKIMLTNMYLIGKQLIIIKCFYYKGHYFLII